MSKIGKILTGDVTGMRWCASHRGDGAAKPRSTHHLGRGRIGTQSLTYKYRIKDRRAAKVLRGYAFQVNQIWNWCVAQHLDTLDRYRAGAKPRKWLSDFDLNKTFKGYGKEIGLHQQTIQCICKQWALNRSRKFRASYGPRRALGWIPFQAQSRQHDTGSITYLGKTFRLFGAKRRPIPDNAKGGYFVEDSLGRWYVCFHVEVERQPTGANAEIGIDLGLKSLVTVSDGRKIESPSYYRRHEQRLSIMQRARNKQRVRRIHAKIKNCRRERGPQHSQSRAQCCASW